MSVEDDEETEEIELGEEEREWEEDSIISRSVLW